MRIFDKDKPCCLATDWSTTGVGYWLLQKHCNCEPLRPFCCRSGWQITLVGSRFTNTAESNYKPIEGEALAVTYALEHAKHFVLGCTNLIIATDHKPLLGVFKSTSLNKWSKRVHDLKEKTYAYRFTVFHVSGAKHKATDAISRKPSGCVNPPKLMNNFAVFLQWMMGLPLLYKPFTNKIILKWKVLLSLLPMLQNQLQN